MRTSTHSAAGTSACAPVAPADAAVRPQIDDELDTRHPRRSVMSKLYIYAGIAASCVMICIGIGAVAIGFDGRSDVRSELARENIVGTPDMKKVANEKIDTGQEARDFAAGMRVHALEASNGQTYAEMPRFLDENGKPVADEKAAAVDPKSGQPVSNPARDLWVTETALGTALNTSYFAR